MEENKEVKGCNGRCELCNINQRTYCAAQMAYFNQQEIAEIKAILAKKNTDDGQSIILVEKSAYVAKESEIDEEVDDRVKIEA